MKRRLLALACAALLLCAALPLSAAEAPGGDFAYTDAKKPMLIEQILQRDGLIDGIWMPWFEGMTGSHSLTANDVMVRYFGEGWSTVAMDTLGADQVYYNIYNLKAMGYNLLGYGGSLYDEGVVLDAYGDVLGVKQEYLDNARRLLDMCREIGMPVMWTICFHSSSSPESHGMDAYNLFAQKYANPTIADHYAQRFVRPVCEMLAEYPDVVALVAIADEPENEINDVELGNHAGGSRAHYGVSQEDMIYFMSRVNDVCQEMLPNVARTVASNDVNKAIYNGFDQDLVGHNRYDNNANIPEVDSFCADAPVILAEYNIGGDGHFGADVFTQKLITFREKMMDYGYKGGIQWAWMQDGENASTAYYLLDSVATDGPNTDFISTVGDLRHYIDDYRAAYRGETVVLDKPVLYCNEGGGIVEWIPSRQATKMDILRSTDGGKSWQTVLKDANQADYVSKNKGRFVDTATPNAMYKIVVRDGKGNTAESDPNNVAGVEQKYKKPTTTLQLDGAIGIYKDNSPLGKYTLTNFGVATHRPASDAANLLANGGFESADGARWNTASFLGSAVSVVTDKTAPEGGKSLYFNTSGTTAEGWYTFTVPVEKNTNYTFSAWIKGAYLSAANSGHASVGVIDPTTGKFMIYPAYRSRSSRANRQIYPTAWDGDWHLRAVSFNSGDLTEVTIALCGDNSQMWLDGLALYKSSDGTKYVGQRVSSRVKVDLSADPLVCKDAAVLTKNSGFANGATYWQDGAGWQGGFLSVTDGALHYTATADGYGTYYTKWVEVQPHTDYAITLDMRIIRSGGGKLVVLDDGMDLPDPVMAFEFDGEVYGTDWGSYCVRFNTAAFTRIGIAVCNLGGEALLDNIRLFKAADGTVPSDDTPTTPDSVTTTPTDTPPTDGDAQPTDGDTAPTAPADDGDTPTLDTPADGDVDPALDEGDSGFPWLWVALGGAVLLIGGGVALFFILRKKK